MLTKSDVAGHRKRSRILTVVLSLALFGALGYLCLTLNALRERRRQWAGQDVLLLIEEEKRAGACIECGECLEKCPQRLEIPEC